jgi:hypothetical protein
MAIMSAAFSVTAWQDLVFLMEFAVGLEDPPLLNDHQDSQRSQRNPNP